MPRKSLPPDEAAKMAKARWGKTPEDERKKLLAKARGARDMSPKARKAIGKRLAEARAKVKRKPKQC